MGGTFHFHAHIRSLISIHNRFLWSLSGGRLWVHGGSYNIDWGCWESAGMPTGTILKALSSSEVSKSCERRGLL